MKFKKGQLYRLGRADRLRIYQIQALAIGQGLKKGDFLKVLDIETGREQLLPPLSVDSLEPCDLETVCVFTNHSKPFRRIRYKSDFFGLYTTIFGIDNREKLKNCDFENGVFDVYLDYEKLAKAQLLKHTFNAGDRVLTNNGTQGVYMFDQDFTEFILTDKGEKLPFEPANTFELGDMVNFVANQFLKDTHEDGLVWRTTGDLGQGDDGKMRFNAMPAYLADPQSEEHPYQYGQVYSLELEIDRYTNVTGDIIDL